MVKPVDLVHGVVDPRCIQVHDGLEAQERSGLPVRAGDCWGGRARRGGAGGGLTGAQATVERWSDDGED
jgi:hypothetical protein